MLGGNQRTDKLTAPNMNSPILVTGASQRVGLALALELAQAGHTVVSASRRVQPQAAHPNIVQFQADLLNVTVQRPVLKETTALGAAYLAGLAAGVWKNLDEVSSLWKLDLEFQPQISDAQREQASARWKKAINSARGWID